MLPSLSQPTSGTRRRTVLFLGALAAAALALPTMKWAAQAQSAGTAAAVADDTARRKETEKAPVFDRRDRPATNSNSRDTVDVEYLPRPSKFEEKVLAALEKPTTVEFMDLGLEDCLQFLKESAEIPFWIDKQPLTDEGVALDQQVTLKLQGARLESVLKLLLKPVQLTYIPENDVLMITTSTKASENLITRTYPVRDLYQGPIRSEAGQPAQKNDKTDAYAAPVQGVANIDSLSLNERPQVIGVIRQIAPTKFAGEIEFQLAQGFGGGGGGGRGAGGMGGAGGGPMRNHPGLVDAITSNIQPDSWEDLSGPGSLTYLKETGCLVIRQTWAVHREILQLLRDLRQVKHVAPGGKSATPAGDAKK